MLGFKQYVLNLEIYFKISEFIQLIRFFFDLFFGLIMFIFILVMFIFIFVIVVMFYRVKQKGKRKIIAFILSGN